MRVDHNGLVYCPACGSETAAPYCAVCGAPIANAELTVGSSQQLGGWWRRVGATFTDNIILLLPTTVVLILIGAIAGSLVGALAGIATQGAYQVLLLSSPRGQTLGNRIVATRVRDRNTGGPISTRQAMWRWGFIAAYSVIALVNSPISTAIATVVALVDVLFPLANPMKQTIHDRLAGTIVVTAS